MNVGGGTSSQKGGTSGGADNKGRGSSKGRPGGVGGKMGNNSTQAGGTAKSKAIQDEKARLAGVAAKNAANAGVPSVPSRTRTYNFNRAPTSEEWGILGKIAMGVVTGSPFGMISGISDSLNSPTAFSGAVSKGDGSLESQGGSKGGEMLSEEEKKKRKLGFNATLLGGTGVNAGALGSSGPKVVPI